jgi:DNA invertase Pin-like site-specific DNA recombinase
MIYGYARVSTDGQTLDAQREALTAAGAERIFQEKVSGAAADRRELKRLLASLQQGDTLLVTRLDRLARSTLELLRTLERVTEAGAGFRSLADTWADTTTPQGRLVLTIMGGFAQFERELIKARTGEGRERAKARGVKLGRRFKLTAHQRHEALERKERGEPVRELARSYGVSPATIARLKA